MSYHKKWKCKRSSHNKSKTSKRDANCQAFIDVLIKKVTPSTKRRDPYLKGDLPHVCKIKLLLVHTHNINTTSCQRTLKVNDEMSDISEEKKNILIKIIDVYTPFLKKLISRLNKQDKPSTKGNRDNMEYVLRIFREGDSKEKLNVYEACKDMLETWFQRFGSVLMKKGDNSDEKAGSLPHSKDDFSDADFNLPSTSDIAKATKDATNESSGQMNRTSNNSTNSNKTNAVSPVTKPVQVVTAMSVTPSSNEAPAEPASTEVTFVCASCQFRTTDEVDFMKHARTDHRTDLSLWCKSCGKCFSNAGVLVSHIKESNCTKEEMIYRCGVKECSFETPSGQTFVHHLRHCHKGSPFIFCVHCQKIFTLPHCLILHMQNDCPFKEKNRRNPGEPRPADTGSPAPAPPVSTPKVTPQVKKTVIKQEPGVTSVSRPPPAPVVTASPRNVPTPRGRARAPIRLTRRSRRYSDSSDSEDADDPSWRPEETSQTQPLRRSARWASRVSDAKNPDLEESSSFTKKSKNFIEQPVPKIVHCPCCDFSAVFESLLRDHYVASHKHEKKNACLVCNVKFENVDLFIQHFYLHEKNMDLTEKDVSESSNDSSRPENTVVESRPAEKKTNSSSEFYKDISLECVPGKTAEISGQNIQIPYQTAIQEKLTKESKIKSFEDLKSNTDVVKMRSEPKLKHFFKCTVLNCTFTTDDDKFYLGHLNERHKDKTVYCTYCFREFTEAQSLTEHILQEHSKRCYQCSVCFYRAVSKPHVQIHIRNNHKTEKAHVYSCSLHLRPNYEFPKESATDLVTVYPYVCAVGDCKYQSFDPKEFSKHTDMNHRSVSQLYCHYCKGDFISLKRLLSHYHLHGINNFQCNYCVHGSETKEEILLHLCNVHADKPFKVYVRDSQETELGNKPLDGIVKQNPIPVAKVLPKKAATVEQDEESLSSPPSFQRNQLQYPEEVLLLDKYFFCRMPFCEKECKSFDNYFNHLKEDHSALNILCPYCSVVCEDSTTFENHVMCHGPNLYACPAEGCKLYSFLKSNVVKHLTNDHTVQGEVKVVREDPDHKVEELNLTSFPKSNAKAQFYICPFCYYENTNFKLMKNHIYAELSYKRFTCNLCKEKLCSRNETKSHFTASHPHHNVKCGVMGNPEIEVLTKIFLTSEVQDKFMEYLQSKDTGDEDILSMKSEYKCEECRLCYHDVADWQYHWVDCVSKENRPYRCNHCGEQFSYVRHLKQHTDKEHAGSHINYTLTENVFLRQTTLRKLQFGKLQFFKSMLTPYLKSKGLYSEKLNSFQFDSKYYKCGYCNFNDTFRCNVQKHISGCHKDKSSIVEKVKNSVDVPKNRNDQSKMMLVDSFTKAQAASNPFVCSFCNKKVQSMDELEKHVATTHDVDTADSYPFYYFPDPKWDYSERGTDLYECAYCNVSQENLFHLKRHCGNLHSGVPFKVRGKRSKDSPTVQCKHCDLKVVSQEMLEKHCLFHHPKESSKSSKNEKPPLKRKGTDDDDLDEPSAKLPKGDFNKYQCGHCEESFLFYVQMITHHKAEHADMSLKFTKGSDSKCQDVQLIACDFCSYFAEEHLMDSHLSIKHKNCFVCAYCGKAFSETSKIVDHIKTKHPHLPVKLVKVDDLSSFNTSESSTLSSHHGSDEGFSNYGRKPEPIDMHNITVDLSSNSNVSSTKAQLPIIYLSQMFPMFPSVRVEDFAKSFMQQ